MEPSQILLTNIITEKICENLTFEEAINFRDAFNLRILKCPVSVVDPDGLISTLKEVSPSTINLYNLLQNSGSREIMETALDNKNIDLVRTLLENGFGVDTLIVEQYNSPLQYLSYLESDPQLLAIAKLLLEYKANPNGVLGGDLGSSQGDALYQATAVNNPELVQLLLDFGAKLDIGTSFPTLARDGYLDVVKILVNAGINVNQFDEDGVTPLIWAVKEGHQEMVRFLLENGASVNEKDGRTALYYANQNGQPQLIDLLKSYGGKT